MMGNCFLRSVASALSFVQSTPELLAAAETRVLQGHVPENVSISHQWTAVDDVVGTWKIHAIHATRANPLNNEDDKPVVVILHGHSAGSASFSAVLGPLSEHFDVYSVDLPGWGRSSAPEAVINLDPEDIQLAYAKIIEEWRKKMKLPKFYLIGHSFGGFIATKMALIFPESLHGLLLVAPGGMFPLAGNRSWSASVYFKFFSIQRFATALGPFSHPLFCFLWRKLSSNSDPLLTEYYFQLASNAHVGLRAFNRFIQFNSFGLRSQWCVPIIQEAASVVVPMAMIWGEHDALVGMDYAKLTHKILRSPLYVVQGATHNPAHGGLHETFTSVVYDAVSAMGVHTLKTEPVAVIHHHMHQHERQDVHVAASQGCVDCNEGRWWCDCVMPKMLAVPSSKHTSKIMAALESHINKLAPHNNTPNLLYVGKNGEFISKSHFGEDC